MRFAPSTRSVRANAPVTLSLDDTGTVLVHDFITDNIGGQEVSVKAPSNSKATGAFALAAGRYTPSTARSRATAKQARMRRTRA
jgi:hypothetical protein